MRNIANIDKFWCEVVCKIHAENEVPKSTFVRTVYYLMLMGY